METSPAPCLPTSNPLGELLAPRHRSVLADPNRLAWRGTKTRLTGNPASQGPVVTGCCRLRRTRCEASFKAEDSPSPEALLPFAENSAVFGFRFGLARHQNDQAPNPPQKRIVFLCPVQDQQLGVSRGCLCRFAGGFARTSCSAGSCS